MAVLLNCFILCVWQFNLVLSAGVNLPFTSMTYKATPINPKSLSLPFSAKESVESKITNKSEDFNLKPVKTPLAIRDELTESPNSVSTLLYKSGLISDPDSTRKDLKFSKQKHNVDPNILYEFESQLQKNVPNLRSYDNEKPNNHQDNKNTVNYNIKVISPPAVFNNFPLSLPATQNVADNNLKTAKLLSETKKYSKKLQHASLLSYPEGVLTKEDQRESTTALQNVRDTLLSNDDKTKTKIENPLVQRNIINISEDDLQQIGNIGTDEDIVFTRKKNARLSYDEDIDRSQFNLNTPTDNLFDYNSQIPKKVLDTSHIKENVISPIVSNIINNNQEVKPIVSTLSKHNYNESTYNNIRDKQIPSNTLFSYASEQPYISDISPTLYSLTNPILPEISKPQEIYTSDSNNFKLVSSLDNIVSFLTSKSNFEFSDISATNSILTPAPLMIPHLSHSHVTTDEPFKFSNYPEVESPADLPKQKVNISLKDTDNITKKAVTKFPVPYISSVTINYMPCIESSDEIILIV